MFLITFFSSFIFSEIIVLRTWGKLFSFTWQYYTWDILNNEKDRLFNRSDEVPHIRATCGCWRLLAVLAGIVWRSWVPEFVQRLKLLTDETRARGRGEIGGITQYPSSSSNNATNTARLLGRYDKSKYHYYKRPDGSKQFYRTGQSIYIYNTKEKGQQEAKFTLAVYKQKWKSLPIRVDFLRTS